MTTSKTVAWRLKGRDTAKTAILALLILPCLGVTYFCHFMRGIDVVFTHFFYVPIVVAGFWWGRRAIWVALLLGGWSMATQTLSGLDIPYTPALLRFGMFIVVGLVAGTLREQTLKIERTLRETRDYLEKLINYANAPIIVWDPAFRITRFNRAFEHITGYTADEVIGHELRKFFPEASRGKSLNEIARTLSGEYWESVEIPILCKDGDIRVTLWNSANIYAEDGRTLLATIAQGQDITDRKAAEEALAASKAYTESIIRNFLDTLIVVDADANIQTVNPATCQLLGYTAEELIGNPVGIIFAEEEEEEVRSVFRFFRESLKAKALHPRDTVRNRELTYKTKDGRLIPMLFNASVLTDEAGHVTAVVAGAKDISDLKLAEAEIRKEKIFSENIVATVPDSLLVLDKDLRIKSANRSFYETFQTEPAKAMGTRITELFGDEDGRLGTELTRLFGTEDILENFELYYPSEKLGSAREAGRLTSQGERIFNVTARGMLVAEEEEEEEEEEELVVLQDITERKQAEEELCRTKQEQEIILDTMSELVVYQDTENRIMWTNRAAGESVGLAPEQLVGHHCYKIWHQRSEPCVGCPVVKAYETSKTQESEVTTPDGRDWFIRGYPIRDANGDVVGIVEVTMDITERKQAEKQMRASLKEKEVLLQEIHHRVKNNLQVVSSLLNMQARATKDKDTIEILSESRNRINAMALIHAQLYESKDLSEVNVKKFVDQLLRQLFQSYPVQEPKITPIVHVADYPLPISAAAPVGLIINELLTNAFKYAFAERKEGKIKVSLDVSEKGKIRLTVSDDGVGLPQGFDMNATKTLGLHLVKILVEDQLRGKLGIIRKEGTTFKIEFGIGAK